MGGSGSGGRDRFNSTNRDDAQSDTQVSLRIFTYKNLTIKIQYCLFPLLKLYLSFCRNDDEIIQLLCIQTLNNSLSEICLIIARNRILNHYSVNLAR